MKNMAAFAAQSFFQHDVGHGMGNPHPSISGVENFLRLVRIRVTGYAVRDGFDVFKNFVLDIQMALVALNFIFGNVFFMHEVGISILVEALRLHMAFEAVFSGDGSISHNGVAVAFVAGIPVVEYKRVVIPGCGFRSELGFMVAVRAFVDLRIVLTFLKMADEAAAFCDCNVFPLNDLRVAAGALKFFSSF